MAWLRKPFPFRAHETGFPFKAGYFRIARHSGEAAMDLSWLELLHTTVRSYLHGEKRAWCVR
jgi:hypothetical protein